MGNGILNGVNVDMAEYGQIILEPGWDATWWFTWEFDEWHWSRMSAVPVNDSPDGASIQILEEWATHGTHWVHFKNNGTDTVVFHPTALVAPGAL